MLMPHAPALVYFHRQRQFNAGIAAFFNMVLAHVTTLVAQIKV
jgi:hypothetical protein